MDYNNQTNQDSLIELSAETCGDMISSLFENTMTQQDFEASIVKDYCVVQCGELRFNSNENLAETKIKIEDWVSENNANFMPLDSNDLFLSIDLIEVHPRINAITFQMFSETEENLRNQLEKFLSFCKELDGIKKIEVEILKTVTPVLWTNEH